MARGLVLLTGSTGHVGYTVLIKTLSEGYTVRAAVRSGCKIASIKAAKSTQPYLDKVSFFIVSDIVADGAFDKAVEGVDYVIHVASPMPNPSGDDEANIIWPAIQGTLSILYSALKEPTVKRVVITSSVVAVEPLESRAFTADDIQPDPHGPYPNTFAAYSASKKLALNRTRDFIAKEKPRFTVIHVMPTFVIGPKELATSKEEVNQGSNLVPLIPILGNKRLLAATAGSCHVEDVAFVHVAALDPKIEGNQNFGVNINVRWDDALKFVKKHFPMEVENGIFPLGGSLGSLPQLFDASSTEKVLGIKFKGFEEQVVDLARQYVQLAAKL